VLVRVDQGGIPRFRCHTGHAFGLDSLLAAMTDSVESALWSALRSVEESILLLREAAAREENADGRPGAVGPRFEQKVHEAEERAAKIRQVVLDHQALSLDLVRTSSPEPEGVAPG
jgi:two-component system chemotaxis response regulator CheB